MKEDQNVEKMLLLLATIYESARLLPAGPLLQRCSLKDGKRLPSCLPVQVFVFFLRFLACLQYHDELPVSNLIV